MEEATARHSPRQVLLRVPHSAGHPAAFMDMPEPVQAGGPPMTGTDGQVKCVSRGTPYVAVNRCLEAARSSGVVVISWGRLLYAVGPKMEKALAPCFHGMFGDDEGGLGRGA